MQYHDCHIYCTRRSSFSVRIATSAVGGQGVWCEKIESAVSVMSHLQYEEKKFAAQAR